MSKQLAFCLAILGCHLAAAGPAAAEERPNILWITSEDNGPYLGCYGDPVARTPHIDRLAAEGVRFLNCFSNAAVCAPARQTLISGMYATSLGGQHMRSQTTFPTGVVYFPQLLREAGYFTSNNSKTDYNGGPQNQKQAMQAAWDQSSNQAHWRKRPPGKPFFSVFNFADSHESRLFPGRWKNRALKTDPARVKLPAYLPDVPEIRRDLARYYDCVEAMDQRVGGLLKQLEEDGLVEDTIVFYFADHGGSLPRGKSFTYDSGTRVPLVVRFPQKWRHLSPAQPGQTSERLVSFVDFAATVLSLAGMKPPDGMQGQAFLGPHQAPPRKFVHTFRGRRGERYDIVRGVRDQKFLYLRNYTPHLPVMQYNGYSFGIPGYAAWQTAWQEGKCNREQSQWFEPKAPEELYRVADDPDNVQNLAKDPEFAEVLARMRAENDRHLLAIRDSVFYPEGMAGREHAAYQDESRYPLKQLIELGAAVSAGKPEHLPRFRQALAAANPCVRYWGAMGCVVLGRDALGAADDLRGCLDDSEPMVRLQAARALAGMGKTGPAVPVIRHFAANGPQILALRAVLAIDECNLCKTDPSLQDTLKQVNGQYAKRVVEKLRRETE